MSEAAASSTVAESSLLLVEAALMSEAALRIEASLALTIESAFKVLVALLRVRLLVGRVVEVTGAALELPAALSVSADGLVTSALHDYQY